MKTRHTTRSLRQKIRVIAPAVPSTTKIFYDTSSAGDSPHLNELNTVNSSRFPPLIFGNNELSREKNTFSIELWQNLCIVYMILDITDFQQNRSALTVDQLSSIYDQMMLQYAYSLIYHYSDVIPIGLTITDLCHIKHDNQVLDSHERFNYYQFKFIQVKNHLLNIYLPIWKDLWKSELGIDLDSSVSDDCIDMDNMGDLTEDDIGYLVTKFRHLLHSSIESQSHSYGTKLLLSWLCFLSFYVNCPSSENNNRLNEKAADFRRKFVLLEFNPVTSLLQYNPVILKEAQPLSKRARNSISSIPGSSSPESSVTDLATQLPPILSLSMNMEQEEDEDDPLTATAILINQQQQLQQNPLYFLQNPSKLQPCDYLMFIQQLLLQQQQLQQTQQQIMAAAVSYTSAVAASSAATQSFPSVPLSSAANLAQQYINDSLANTSSGSVPSAQHPQKIQEISSPQQQTFNQNPDLGIGSVPYPSTKRLEKGSSSFDIIEFPILMTPSNRISRAMHPRTIRIWQHLCSSYAIMEFYLSSSSTKGFVNGRSVESSNRLPQQSKQDYIEKAFHRYCEKVLKIYSDDLPLGISIYELQGTVTGHQICFSTFTNMSRAVQIIYIPAYEHLVKECISQFGPNFIVNASNYDQILYQLRAKIWKLEHLEINANDNEQQNESVRFVIFLAFFPF
jgi:hypothetical protein